MLIADGKSHGRYIGHTTKKSHIFKGWNIYKSLKNNFAGHTGSDKCSCSAAMCRKPFKLEGDKSSIASGSMSASIETMEGCGNIKHGIVSLCWYEYNCRVSQEKAL